MVVSQASMDTLSHLDLSTFVGVEVNRKYFVGTYEDQGDHLNLHVGGDLSSDPSPPKRVHILPIAIYTPTPCCQ